MTHGTPTIAAIVSVIVLAACAGEGPTQPATPPPTTPGLGFVLSPTTLSAAPGTTAETTVTVHRRIVPVQVTSLGEVMGISAWHHRSVALRSDGSVWVWGSEVPAGVALHTIPMHVPSLSDIALIDAGSMHVVVVGRDGSAWAWGWNSEGQLGDGSRVDRSAPVEVGSLGSVRVP
jgi:hypothetical protein